MSASNFQTGVRSDFAHRSQTAFTMAAVARWMTPLSGPSQRSWLSPVVMLRQNAPMSRVISSRVLPTTKGASELTAATQISLPRPMVNVRP